MKKYILILFSWSIVLCLPMIINAGNTFPRLDSDYDSNLSIYQYIVSFIWRYHSFPWQIPILNGGISVLGDPLNGFLNPLLGISLIALGINYGVRLSILLTCFASGLSMFCLLICMRVKKIISLWSALLYMSGGAFVAAVASGHIEKYLVYPLVPLVLLFGIHQKLNKKHIVGLGFVFAGAVYSGDLYAVWFFFLLHIAIRAFYLFRTKTLLQLYYFLFPLLIFVFLASPKLYFFSRDVLPIMQRFSSINPYKGSLHFFLFPLPFIMPLGVWFWDRPFFQKHLVFYFNWYEYFAFITPLPFIFLLALKKVWKKEEIKISVVLLFVGMFYFSLAYPYSPFFWLFHLTPLAAFIRVPQRIVLPMTSVLIFLLAMCLQTWIDKKILSKTTVGLLVLTLVWTLFVDWNIISKTFVKIPQEEISFAQKVAFYNPSRAPVTNLSAASQYLLVKNSMPIANFYYGWVPKTTLFSKTNEANLSGQIIVLSPKNMLLETKGYKAVYRDSKNIIWQKK